jgi:hypothetical protein
MSFEQRIASLFGLDEEGWARHANPVSGWSRALTGLPVLIVPAVARIWIGWWALPLGVLAIAWLVLNPRMFSPPANNRAWMTRAVLGERLWVERKRNGLPEARSALPHGFNALAGVGFVIMAYGLVVLDALAISLGALLSWTAKMAFIDRTRSIYDRVVARDPSYAYEKPA